MRIYQEDISQANLDEIDIDNSWNFENEKEEKIHSIHAYPAKFPAFITQKALQKASAEITVNTVADIFCGCGTTAYESSHGGIDFWGCDINPVATLIAKVKSRAYKKETLDRHFEGIKDCYQNLSINEQNFCDINDRIFYWFEKEQIEQLLKIKLAIQNSIPTRSKYVSFFMCAFSNILKPTSRWLQKSIKPTIDPNKKRVDVWQTFSKQFKMMKNAVQDEHRRKKGKFKIETINILNKRHCDPFVDLLITSPPYVTSYEYADLHQLSSLWLDYVDDYRELRKGAIGSMYYNAKFKANKRQLNKTGNKTVATLENIDMRRAKSVAKYYIDIQKCVKKSYLLLNNGGRALFVIGNTEYKKIQIDNAKHLIESMYEAGFKDIDVIKRKISNKILTPYRTESGRFTENKDCRKIYAEEFLVWGKKE